MTIVATMEVRAITKTEIDETVTLQAVYTDKSNNLDNNYSAVLPQASAVILVTNCEAFGQFVPGKRYRVEFVPL